MGNWPMITPAIKLNLIKRVTIEFGEDDLFGTLEAITNVINAPLGMITEQQYEDDLDPVEDQPRNNTLCAVVSYYYG